MTVSWKCHNINWKYKLINCRTLKKKKEVIIGALFNTSEQIQSLDYIFIQTDENHLMCKQSRCKYFSRWHSKHSKHVLVLASRTHVSGYQHFLFAFSEALNDCRSLFDGQFSAQQRHLVTVCCHLCWQPGCCPASLQQGDMTWTNIFPFRHIEVMDYISSLVALTWQKIMACAIVIAP